MDKIKGELAYLGEKYPKSSTRLAQNFYPNDLNILLPHLALLSDSQAGHKGLV